MTALKICSLSLNKTRHSTKLNYRSKGELARRFTDALIIPSTVLQQTLRCIPNFINNSHDFIMKEKTFEMGAF